MESESSVGVVALKCIGVGVGSQSRRFENLRSRSRKFSSAAKQAPSPALSAHSVQFYSAELKFKLLRDNLTERDA